MRLAKQSQFIPLQNVVYFITLPFLVRKLFTFYIMVCYYLNVQFQGQRVKQLTSLCPVILLLKLLQHRCRSARTLFFSPPVVLFSHSVPGQPLPDLIFPFASYFECVFSNNFYLLCILIIPYKLNFIFKPCIDMTSLNNNQLMHSQFNIY